VNIHPRAFIRYIVLHALFGLTLAAGNALADKQYGPGVTDTEVKLGQTMPYSGPASAYANYGKVETGYFQMINDRGGINGRKIQLISLDDGFSPPKTVEQTRRLIEEEQVLMIFGSLGTAPNSAIMRYLNDRKVPQIFLATAAAKFYDPKNFPWTMGILFNYQQEAALYARYLLKAKPDAKVAILFQNDDFGKDFVKGFKAGLGEKAARLVVAEASYEVTDPSIDSQIVMLQSSGADALLDATTSKFAAQAVRKIWDMGWKPMHFLTFPSSSIATVLTPAGVEKSVGILSASSGKDPSDPQWAEDAQVRDYFAFMRRYYPDGNVYDQHNLIAYISAFMMAHVLTRCGDELTRENVMRQATSMRSLEVPMLQPGIRVNTSPTEYQQIHQMRMRRFDGKRWVSFGDLIDTTSQ
jgi:ABC-type branched-subunit amino acid transport system substrate-binding protein